MKIYLLLAAFYWWGVNKCVGKLFVMELTMYHRKINPKAIIPFTLSFTAAQLVCAGFASAKNYELNYIDVNGGQEGIIIQDTIADDKSYDITVNIDNPVRGEGNGLEVKIGSITKARAEIIKLAITT